MGRRDAATEDGADIIWEDNNGLPMLKKVETAFEDGRCVIAPFNNGDDDESLLRFKLVVLDASLFKDVNDLNVKHGKRTTWKELHNAELEFLHPHNCPARRNLFFHYVTTLLRREYYEPPDWFKDPAIVADIRGVWATPGEWFRRSTLQHLIHLVGRVSPDGPLESEAKTWFEKNCYDEPARINVGENHPANVDERLSRELFGVGVTTSLPYGSSDELAGEDEEVEDED